MLSYKAQPHGLYQQATCTDRVQLTWLVQTGTSGGKADTPTPNPRLNSPKQLQWTVPQCSAYG
jgi:hypothetical protein